jgi:two-component system chemotaxis response regulator CheV
MSIGKDVEQMTQAHLRNVQQLAVFYTGAGNVYAINIAKIKAFIITEEVTITETPTDTAIIAGIATIRGEPVTLINLDIWLGNKVARDILDYKLIIYCEFNHKRVGFLIKDMINIVEKTTEELRNSEEQNSKITYTTYVKVNGENKLCTVFNAEQLLRDIGWTSSGDEEVNKYVNEPIITDKVVLVAEDSAVAREILKKFLQKVEVKYEMFNNGQELISRLTQIDPKTVGLIITDIEMPEKDGYQVASFVKENSKFNGIPLVVNSSMTTDAVVGKMKNIGVDGFIGKTDIPRMYSICKKFLERAY